MTKKHKTSPRTRRLALENLETRELLSINPVVPTTDDGASSIEARNAAIYAAVQDDCAIRFTLDDCVELSNAAPEPVVLKQPVVNYYKAFPTSVDLGWSVCDGAQSYEVFYRKSTVKKYASCGVTVVNNMTINDLTPGATYHFMIVAKGDGVETLDSASTGYSEIKTPQYQKLATPKIALSSEMRSISVTWNEVTNASNYLVEYRKSSEKTFTVCDLYDNMNRNAAINNLEPGVSYVVRVTAKGDGVFTLDSAAATKSIKTVAIPKLTQPTITSVTSNVYDISVAWKDVPDAIYYSVRLKNMTGKGVTEYRAMPGEENYTIYGLDANTSYQVKVVAIGNHVTALDSSDAKYKSIKTKPLQKLAQPTINGYGSYKHSIYVQWNDIQDADGYSVQWRASTEKTWNSEYVPRTDNFRYIENLDPNVSYVVRVVALGDQNLTLDSASTKTKKIKTQPLDTLPQPKIIESLALSERAVRVEWSAIEDASRYAVTYRSSNAKTATTEYIDATQTNYIIRCEPGSKFTITVAALGDNYETKDSAPTKPVTVATPALAKLPTPVILSTQASDSAITVNWKRVAGAYDYLVTYKRVGSKETLTATAPTHVGLYKCAQTITQLVQGAKYVISIVAIPDPYFYLDSAPATVTVATSKAPKALAPTVKMVATNSLDLSNITVELEWTPVNNAREYEVVFGRTGGGVAEKKYFYTSETSVSFTVPDKTQYYCKFRAIGVEGYLDSDFSELYPFWV